MRITVAARCFAGNGEQWKAPAEKESHIRYAHARQQATVATRRQSRGLEEPGLQNVGEPVRAAEQILRPHADDLEDRSCHASSASGWRLDEEAVTPKQGVIVIGRAA